MSAGQRRFPAGSRRRIQGIDVPAPQPGMLTMIGLRYAEGAAFPDNLRQYSSSTYSLGSPADGTLKRIGLLSYSLGSPSIPGGFRRVVVLP